MDSIQEDLRHLDFEPKYAYCIYNLYLPYGLKRVFETAVCFFKDYTTVV